MFKNHQVRHAGQHSERDRLKPSCGPVLAVALGDVEDRQRQELVQEGHLYLDMVEGRSKQAFTNWLVARPQEWRAGIEVVAMDGFTGFKTRHRRASPPRSRSWIRSTSSAWLGMRSTMRRRIQQTIQRHRGAVKATCSTPPDEPCIPVLVYAFFLTTSLAWLFARAARSGSPWRRLVLSPAVVVLLDYAENLCTVTVMTR